MGYYVYTADQDIFLSKHHFDYVYQKMCELNEHDELKRGGQSPEKPKEPGQKWNPNKWFSWMAYNYPQICVNMEEVLQQVGFVCSFDDEGNLVGLSYEYNKTGQEEYFLACFSGYMKPGSYLDFKGEEEDDYYRYVWTENDMEYHRAQITRQYECIEVINYGEMNTQDKIFAEWKAQKKMIDQERSS